MSRKWLWLIAPWVVLAVSVPAIADDQWTLVNVRGSVFTLAEVGWLEAHEGEEVVPGTAVRTLQAGRVDLRHGADVFSLAPRTAVRPTVGSAGLGLDQYAGTLTFKGKTATRYRLTTPALAVSPSHASLTLRVDGKKTILAVSAGTVPVSIGGDVHTIDAGQTLTGAPGGAVSVTSAAAGDSSTAASGASATVLDSSKGATGGLPSAKMDNGKGNAGTPGNGGVNGNGHNK